MLPLLPTLRVSLSGPSAAIDKVLSNPNMKLFVYVLYYVPGDCTERIIYRIVYRSGLQADNSVTDRTYDYCIGL